MLLAQLSRAGTAAGDLNRDTAAVVEAEPRGARKSGLGMVMAWTGDGDGHGWRLWLDTGCWHGLGAWVTRTALGTRMGLCRDGDGSGLGAGDGPVRGSGDQGLA